MADFFYFNYGGMIFVVIAMIISFLAQQFVMRSYRQYSNIRVASGLTGAETARQILDENGLYDVKVVLGRGGELSDFYHPTDKVVSLSPKVYQQASIASVSVAAHEVGHAIQHAKGYAMIAVRNKILPLANIASSLSMFPIFLGIIGGFDSMFYIGIVMLGVVALFQLVTLPVEFDASKRALRIIKADGRVTASEFEGAQKMLTAAALTYVAALLGSLLTILRYVSMNNRRNRR